MSIDQLNSAAYGINLQTFGTFLFTSSPSAAPVLSLSSLNVRNQATLSCQILICNAGGDEHAGFIVNGPSGTLNVTHKISIYKGQLYYNEKSGSGVTFVVYGTDSSNSSIPSTTGNGGDSDNSHSSAGTRQSFLKGALTYLKSLTSWWSCSLENPIITPEQQKLTKLKERAENLMRGASHLDKWYVYNLEDFVEDLALTLQHPKNIDAMTVKHFNRRLKGIREDFKSEPYNKHVAMPLLLENHDYGKGTPLSYGCFLPALTPALMNGGHLHALGH